MKHARALALSFATAALYVSLPAAAQTPADAPPPAAPAVVTPPPAAPQPAAYPPAAPLAAQPPPPGYAPPPSAYYPPPPGGIYPEPPGLPPPIVRRSTAAMAGGIVLSSIGAVLLVTSVVAFAIPSCDTTLDDVCRTGNAAPVGLLVASVVAIGAGIPLILWGAKGVPLSDASVGSARPALPAWAGEPRAHGWAWKF